MRSAEKLAAPPRFVLASSIAVYGSRNPHTVTGPLTADTPVNPADIYGDHKVKAEKIVRTSALDWVILRLGGVLTATPGSYMKLDNFYFEGMLPTDGRLQTVDVRDVATAFAAATTVDAIGETLLIGGDDATHRLLQGDVAPAMAAALGLVGGLPAGLKGDPHNDASWFNTDWMDTTRAQQAAWLPTSFVAGHADRDGRQRRHQASTAAVGRTAGQTDPQAPDRVLRHRPALRRPVEGDREEVGRPPTGRRHRVNTPGMKTAIVVGGASGIGWASAQALAADGYRVVIADRNADGAAARAAELGAPHTAAGVDVVDEGSVATLFEQALGASDATTRW